MAYYCYPCDRNFVSQNSYNQHVNNSSAHQQSYGSFVEEPEPEPEPGFDCDACYASFYTFESREQHHATSHGDRYCVPCRRMFMNANNLIQHQHSRAHVGSSLKCPFCNATSATASGVIIHLESGSCPSGVNRQKTNDAIRRLDPNHIITNRLLNYPTSTTTTATDRSWNGYAYECYLCPRQTATLDALNKHLNSPAHEQDLYHCPNRACGKQFKLLSGLVQHVESESCGFMRFQHVQQGAWNGISKMVGRMIGM